METQPFTQQRKVKPITRIINYFFDNLMIFLLFFVLIYIVTQIWDSMLISTFQALVVIAYTGVFYAYYFIMEYLLGRTVGKFITHTKVVDEMEQSPNLKAIAIRTLLRLVPFEAFTFMFPASGIHDTLSKTKLIFNK
jgi:hypothetical protein